MDYLIHSATDGQRWDQLADLYYGDPTLLGGIVQANPQLAITPTLQAGASVAIPIVDDGTDVDPGDLPPWKQ